MVGFGGQKERSGGQNRRPQSVQQQSIERIGNDGMRRDAQMKRWRGGEMETEDEDEDEQRKERRGEGTRGEGRRE
jgi:hypothetical protein